MKLLVTLITFMLGFSILNAQSTDLKNSIVFGESIYSKKCAVCHSINGTGKGKRIPPIANSDYLLNKQEASIRGILFGQKGKIKVNGISYNRKMKAIKLTDLEVAHVMNYIQNSWGNKNEIIVTEAAVSKIRFTN